MGINIAGGADITVTKPLLNFFQAYAIGVKQAGAAMAQIVETDALPGSLAGLSLPTR